MYYLLMNSSKERDAFISRLMDAGICSVFHYIPLDSSPAGRRYGRASGTLNVAKSVSERLVRLPLWVGVEDHLDICTPKIIETVRYCAGSL